MKITLLAVGTKRPHCEEGYNSYAKRCSGTAILVLKEIKAEKRSSNVAAQQGIAAQHNRIIAAVPPRHQLVALGEHGQRWTTLQFANAIKEWPTSAEGGCFVVGGADGLSEQLKRRSDTLLRLSEMPLAHAIVRIVLAEQLYRATSILNHHPYHRQ